MASYRTVFLSDVHLGTRASHAARLRTFLNNTQMEFLYLVGDIVDVWALRKTWFWPTTHGLVIRDFFEKAKNGTHVTYLPGNHDDEAKVLNGCTFNGVMVSIESIHTTQDGKRLLVTHGDAFDPMLRFIALPEFLVKPGFHLASAFTWALNLRRKMLGLKPWSLAQLAIAAGGEKAGERFMRLMVAEAKRKGLDGVVCGHSHRPCMREIDGILYANDGDFTDAATVLVEHMDGRLELLQV